MSEIVDTLDIDILELLRQDGRMTIKDIADTLDRRRATIHNRIKKMEEKDVIKGYTVIPDFSKIGYEITVFILVSLIQREFENAESLQSLGERIATIPYITEVHTITGDFDYLVKARVKSLEDIGTEIYFRLRKLFGVGRTLTLATFRTDLEELGNDIFRFFSMPQ